MPLEPPASNPMLTKGFIFCSLHCEPLVPAVAAAAGLPDRDRSNSVYGDGGPGGYEMGFDLPAGEEIYFFSASPYGADDIVWKMHQLNLRRAFLDKLGNEIPGKFANISSIVFTAPDFSDDFLWALSATPLPVKFVRAQGDPWFAPVAVPVTDPVDPENPSWKATPEALAWTKERTDQTRTT